MREELGGDKHFTCFACENKKTKIRLREDICAPKSDGFIHGKRYRIETNVENDDNETDNDETDNSEADDDDAAEVDLEVCKLQI